MWKSLSVLSLLITAFLTAGCDGNSRPVAQDILVSTDWLQSQLNDPSTIVLHAGSEELFDSTHIPGARLILPGDFVVSSDNLRNELPAVDSVVNLLRRVGVNKDSRIVLCYESARLISWTARVYVTLVHAGLADRTFVLNGGLPAWLEEERETTDLAADVSPGNLEAMAPVEVIIKASDLNWKRYSGIRKWIVPGPLLYIAVQGSGLRSVFWLPVILDIRFCSMTDRIRSGTV
jgi:3-mercaptopyruvate sulfurtransferase SseA